MPVKFGPRKVGQAQFEKSKISEELKSKFGPRKFGARKAAARAANLVAAEAAVEAEKAGEPIQPVKPVVPARVVGDVPTATSIKQIDEALIENPALYEELYQLELERPEGPRKGALRLFQREEMARDTGPRDERMIEIADLVKPKS